MENPTIWSWRMSLIGNQSSTCCFIGHRKIEITDELKSEIYGYIDNLILKENVRVFLFGSKSDFDFLCHSIVTDLKEKYPFIKRVAYTCRSESVILESECEKWNEVYSYYKKQDIHLLGVEEEFEYKTKYVSGKASYVERNQAMIDDSDYCLFYYNEKYVPPKRQEYGGFRTYQPKSGTAIAFKYAKRKKKIIKNFYK